MSLDTNQLHVWHFNESSGNAADSVGSMTLTNNGSIPYGAGLLGNCAIFSNSGSNDYFNNSAAPFWTSATPGAYTINFWTQVTAPPPTNNANVWLNTDGSSNPGSVRMLYQDNSGTPFLRFSHFFPTNVGIQTDFTTTLSTNTWYMITMVWTGTSLILYLNGSSVATNSAVGFAANDGGSSFTRVGGQASTDSAPGKLDEYGVWTRALSGAEITQLYNGGAGLAYPYASPANGNFLALM